MSARLDAAGQSSFNQHDSGAFGIFAVSDATYKAVVASSMLSAVREWYGTASDYYPDGDLPGGTGPLSSESELLFQLFDIADLDAVQAGSKASYTVQPAVQFDPTSLISANILAPCAGDCVGTSATNGYGRAARLLYDATTKYVYIIVPGVDTTTNPGLFNGVVYVAKLL